MADDRLKYIKHVLEVQKGSAAVVLRRADAEWAADTIEFLSKVKDGQAAMISKLRQEQKKHWKESLCIEALLRKKLSKSEMEKFILELEDEMEKTEFSCPVCENEQIKPGQEFCQICGHRLKVK